MAQSCRKWVLSVKPINFFFRSLISAQNLTNPLANYSSLQATKQWLILSLSKSGKIANLLELSETGIEPSTSRSYSYQVSLAAHKSWLDPNPVTGIYPHSRAFLDILRVNYYNYKSHTCKIALRNRPQDIKQSSRTQPSLSNRIRTKKSKHISILI